MEASSPQIVWLFKLPRRFGIMLEKFRDRHDRSGIAVQWNGGGGGGVGNFNRQYYDLISIIHVGLSAPEFIK